MRINRLPWDRCCDFKFIFALIFGENIGVFLLKLLLVFQKFVHNIVFWEKGQFIRRTLAKIEIITLTPCFLTMSSPCLGFLFSQKVDSQYRYRLLVRWGITRKTATTHFQLSLWRRMRNPIALFSFPKKTFLRVCLKEFVQSWYVRNILVELKG
jgi:hypothetical protein